MISTNIFYRSPIRSIFPKMTQKSFHSTFETLIFMTMQNVHIYTQYLMHIPNTQTTFIYPILNAYQPVKVGLPFLIHSVYYFEELEINLH